MSYSQAGSLDARLAEAIAALGFDALRDGQEAVIRRLVAGQDALAVMPTGSGKSAIYQIAGMLLPGMTVVVSPLIALQRDQVASLEETDPGAALELNSTLGDAERAEVLDDVRAGRGEFLFLAPEQFANEETMSALRAADVSLFVVDEAHCISEWGYDFRPGFLKLGAAIAELGAPTILALTATASPVVRADIVEQLGMRDPAVLVHGFDRPELRFAVETFTDETERRDALLDRVVANAKPGIVYATTRALTGELAAMLCERGVTAAAYHAGMKADARADIQSRFMNDELEVIVATVAFGMGIDKPNVRFVMHATASASLDAYYQEVGRAGRDGQPAEAVLFYHPDDLRLQRFLNGAAGLEPEQVEQVMQLLTEAGDALAASELLDATDLSATRLERALRRLEETGVLTIEPDGAVSLVESDIDPEEAAREAVERQRNRGRFLQSRIEMMRQYAETTACRRAFLLNYFGEATAETCGACDNCLAGHTAPVPAADPVFPVHAKVVHVKWGNGEVIRQEPDRVTVLFETVGYRTLALELVEREGLLQQIA